MANPKSNSTITSIEDESLDAPAATVTQASPTEAAPNNGLSGKRTLLTIHPSDGDSGNDAVFFGLNGTAYLVPRGTPQEVPVELVDQLRNMVTTTLHAMPGGEIVERTVSRYAFSVNG